MTNGLIQHITLEESTRIQWVKEIYFQGQQLSHFHFCLPLCVCSHSPNDIPPPNLSGTYPLPRYGAPCVRSIVSLFSESLLLYITLLHSELPKLYGVMARLSALGLNHKISFSG